MALAALAKKEIGKGNEKGYAGIKMALLKNIK